MWLDVYRGSRRRSGRPRMRSSWGMHYRLSMMPVLPDLTSSNSVFIDSQFERTEVHHVPDFNI